MKIKYVFLAAIAVVTMLVGVLAYDFLASAPPASDSITYISIDRPFSPVEMRYQSYIRDYTECRFGVIPCSSHDMGVRLLQGMDDPNLRGTLRQEACDALEEEFYESHFGNDLCNY